MKKHTTIFRSIIFVFFLSMFSLSQAQVKIYSENCGTPTISPIAISANIWSNTSVSYIGYPTSGNQLVEVRNNQRSIYSDGNPFASEGGNVYLNGRDNSGDSYFEIRGINTGAYNNIKLSFGLFGKTIDAIKSFMIAYSTNNGVSYNILKSFASETNAEKQWLYISNILGLPNSSNLYLKFYITTDVKIRLDDILITGTVGTNPAPSVNVISTLTRFETNPSADLITKNISIEGLNLTGDITLTLPENSTFTLSKSTILQADGLTDIAITYDPTSVGYNEDTLLINTPDMLYPIAVKLFGKCNFLKPENLTANNFSETSFTLNWDAVAGANQYLVNITKIEDTGIAETNIFTEDFSKMIETVDLVIGDRIDELFSISNYMNSTGWVGKYIYDGSDDDLGEVPGVVRIGKKEGGKGYLNTPIIDLSGENVYLKFKIRTFTKSNSKEETSIKVSHAPDGLDYLPLETLVNLFPEFQEYTIKIANGTTSSKIRFEGIISDGDITLNNRFVLEDLQIVKGGIQTQMVQTNQLVNTNSYEVSGLNPDDNYDINIRAYNTDVVFVSPESNNLNLTPREFINSGNGIKEIKNSSIFISNNIIYIQLIEKSKIEVYDILGKQILIQKGNAGTNMIQKLKSEQIYILKIGKDTFKIKL